MITEIALPRHSQLSHKRSAKQFSDAYQFTSKQEHQSAKHVYHAIFAHLPISLQWLMKLRNCLVKPFGFVAASEKMAIPLDQMEQGTQSGFLKIEQLNEDEIICAAYEKNMDIWISVLKVSTDTYCVVTLVHLKTPFSQVYMSLIKPLHRIIAKYAIKQAIKHKRC